LLDRELAEMRIVSCHLGAGASLAAVLRGRSVDTTMGFTPLEGLVMATRSGSVDPGLIVWLLQHGQLGLDDLSAGLEKQSGLAGLSGLSSGDMREVLQAAGSGAPAALLAIEVYLHRLRREVAAMAAAMNGLDALVFTGGIGEHSSQVRAAAAAGLEFLGVTLDPGRNQANADAIISRDNSAPATLVVTAREDIEMARQARRALAAS
jgi:acetate kinase